MTHNYPPFEALGIAPDYLWIGSCAMHNLHALGYLARALPDLDEPEDSAPAPSPRRMYESKFVGVTRHRGRWLSQWGKTHKERSGVYPETPEGAEAAAWERARALGRDWLELREPERVKGTPEAARALEQRGRGRTKLAGKRIG